MPRHKVQLYSLYDLEPGACVYMNSISGKTIFVTTEREATNGVNKEAQAPNINMDEQTIIPYILTIVNNIKLDFKLPSRANLPGADDFVCQAIPATVSGRPRKLLPTRQGYEYCFVYRIIQMLNRFSQGAFYILSPSSSSSRR
jgi:hypothetical protein